MTFSFDGHDCYNLQLYHCLWCHVYLFYFSATVLPQQLPHSEPKQHISSSKKTERFLVVREELAVYASYKHLHSARMPTLRLIRRV